MAELTTVARPYAQAVFERAQETGRFADWSAELQFAAAVAVDPQMADTIESTRLTKAELAELFISVCAERLNDDARNLVRLLAENRRLMLLPEIAAVYEVLRAAAERTIEAEMVSAFPLDDAQRGRIAEALKARLGRNVTLSATVDESLIGGAIIRAGDLVIDGSVRGKLGRLASALNH